MCVLSRNLTTLDCRQKNDFALDLNGIHLPYASTQSPLPLCTSAHKHLPVRTSRGRHGRKCMLLHFTARGQRGSASGDSTTPGNKTPRAWPSVSRRYIAVTVMILSFPYTSASFFKLGLRVERPLAKMESSTHEDPASTSGVGCNEMRGELEF